MRHDNILLFPCVHQLTERSAKGCPLQETQRFLLGTLEPLSAGKGYQRALDELEFPDDGDTVTKPSIRNSGMKRLQRGTYISLRGSRKRMARAMTRVVGALYISLLHTSI